MNFMIEINSVREGDISYLSYNNVTSFQEQI